MIFKLIKENKYQFYVLSSGIYGFLRSFNGSYNPPDDVFGNRLLVSVVNGFMYSAPVYSEYYKLKLLNRIHIKLSNKDPSLYKDSYKDMFSYNMNVFI